MTETTMYEDIRQQRRQNIELFEAIANTLQKAGSVLKPFTKGENHIYVNCSGMPPSSIRTIDFLTKSHGLTWKIQAFTEIENFDNEAVKIAVPYIHIYKDIFSNIN